jgi:hypothetical protein
MGHRPGQQDATPGTISCVGPFPLEPAPESPRILICAAGGAACSPGLQRGFTPARGRRRQVNVKDRRQLKASPLSCVSTAASATLSTTIRRATSSRPTFASLQLHPPHVNGWRRRVNKDRRQLEVPQPPQRRGPKKPRTTASPINHRLHAPCDPPTTQRPPMMRAKPSRPTFASPHFASLQLHPPHVNGWRRQVNIRTAANWRLHSRPNAVDPRSQGQRHHRSAIACMRRTTLRQRKARPEMRATRRNRMKRATAASRC